MPRPDPSIERERSVAPRDPPLDLATLRQLFPASGHRIQLDSSCEPDSPKPDPEKVARFAILQKYNRVNLVVPLGAQHMYYAAMEGKSCQLTVLGEHYRRLVERGRI